MKPIAKSYLSNRECSVQEVVNYILLEFKLRRIFSAAYFVNTNPPEEIVQVLLSGKELRKLATHNPNILKKSNIDRYIERSGATFCNEKYSMLDGFCYAEYLRYYTLENKSRKTCEY